MLNFETWYKIVDDFDTYYKKKKARITDVDGNVWEGFCLGYVEDEDSNGDACWEIRLACWSEYPNNSQGFIQEDVEKVEFLD